MNITLKNIKHAAFASQETNCYSATIYVDGKKRGTVDNDGRGGCDNVDWDDKEFGLTMYAWEKAQPKIKTQFGEMDYDIEFLFGDIVNDWLLTKELKRNLKKGLLVRDSNTKAGTWRIFNHRLSQTVPQAMLDNLINKGSVGADAICLNLLPTEEAVKLWGAV